MVVQSRKHAAEKPRKRIEPVIQKEAKKMGTPGGGERAKKRRRKRKSQSGVDEAERSQVRPQQTLQQPAGLFANSFLFQPLD